MGEDQPGAGLEGGDRLLPRSRPDAVPGSSSTSTWWATAAPPASATAVRCPSRWPQAVQKENLVVAAVLSGNRNFEGRINPLVKANYLASPPLVVAYALAGTHGHRSAERAARRRTPTGKPVYLRDIWPTNEEVQPTVRAAVKRGHVRSTSTRTSSMATRTGRAMPFPPASIYEWDDAFHLHQEAAVLRPHGGPERADPGSARTARAGAAGRFRDHRPHLAGRVDSEGQPGRAST